jgi:siroheme synthase
MQDWTKYAPVDTIVVLMGVKNRAFIAQSLLNAGRKAEEPIAFIERGTWPDERVIESTLGAVAAGEIEVGSPAVFVIGEVVRLRAQLAASELLRALPELAVEAQSNC